MVLVSVSVAIDPPGWPRGISAQGGDYRTHPEVAQKAPTDRPLVVTTSSRSTDIGLPFAWFDDLLRRRGDGN
jgi:hypothetical protein